MQLPGDSKPLAFSCTTSATKAGPLPDPIDTGIPNQGMISFSRCQATSPFSVHIGKASTHPEKVQINANRLFASLSSQHFSKVHNQVFKRSSANTLYLRKHPWLLPELHLSHTALLMLESLET
jgi:hypothetical protein